MKQRKHICPEEDQAWFKCGRSTNTLVENGKLPSVVTWTTKRTVIHEIDCQP